MSARNISDNTIYTFNVAFMAFTAFNADQPVYGDYKRDNRLNMSIYVYVYDNIDITEI